MTPQANALREQIGRLKVEREQMKRTYDKRVEQLERRAAEYKRLWQLRGEALKRGCPKCGYVQLEIAALERGKGEAK